MGLGLLPQGLWSVVPITVPCCCYTSLFHLEEGDQPSSWKQGLQWAGCIQSSYVFASSVFAQFCKTWIWHVLALCSSCDSGLLSSTLQGVLSSFWEIRECSRVTLLQLQHSHWIRGFQWTLLAQLPSTGVEIHWWNSGTGSAFLKEAQTIINLHRTPADREARPLKVAWWDRNLIRNSCETSSLCSKL